MSYESWRISYQDSEQAARAAYDEAQAVFEEYIGIAKLISKNLNHIGSLSIGIEATHQDRETKEACINIRMLCGEVREAASLLSCGDSSKQRKESP